MGRRQDVIESVARAVSALPTTRVLRLAVDGVDGAGLLGPLGPGGSRRYRVAAFDHRTDRVVETLVEIAAPGDILIFDGIFLDRPELRAHWDYSVFLEVRFAVSVARMAERDASSPDPDAASNRRYVGGQEIYLARCQPRRWASVVINNDDLDSPYIVEPAREVTS